MEEAYCGTIKPSTPHTVQITFTAIRKKYLTLGFFLRREEWRLYLVFYLWRSSQTTAFCLTWLVLTSNWWTLLAWGTLRRSCSLLQHQRACSFTGNYQRNQQIIRYKKRRKRRRRNLNALNWKHICKGPEKIPTHPPPPKAGLRSLLPRISGQVDWTRIFRCRKSVCEEWEVWLFSQMHKTGEEEGSQSVLSKWKHDSKDKINQNLTKNIIMWQNPKELFLKA